jgi:hypothetical protein
MGWFNRREEEPELSRQGGSDYSRTDKAGTEIESPGNRVFWTVDAGSFPGQGNLVQGVDALAGKSRGADLLEKLEKLSSLRI